MAIGARHAALAHQVERRDPAHRRVMLSGRQVVRSVMLSGDGVQHDRRRRGHRPRRLSARLDPGGQPRGPSPRRGRPARPSAIRTRATGTRRRRSAVAPHCRCSSATWPRAPPPRSSGRRSPTRGCGASRTSAPARRWWATRSRCFARFRGGRSVLTFVGGAAVFAPIPVRHRRGRPAGGLRRRRGRSPYGARAGFVVLPFATLVVQGPYQTAAMGVLMTFIGVRFLMAHRARHRRTDRR